MKLSLACDHGGLELKLAIKAHLEAQGHEVVDFGTHDHASCDYPDYAHPLAESVEKGEVDLGIAICGSANGISMTCNKHQGVRCALSWETEIASLARQHNNANIVGLPARFISKEKALEIVKIFLTTDFEGGRHEKRVAKIAVK